MTVYERISEEYFEWLYEMMCSERYSDNTSYRNLLIHLHNIEFRYLIPNDQNRAEDGAELRYRFAVTHGYRYTYESALRALPQPCSVLEMMIALAVRCEENIMDDPKLGDRTGQWFWAMVTNLGLGSMHDELYDFEYVQSTIDRFLDRRYSPDGRGGLFTIRNADRDLRDVEIAYQLFWYLDNIAT